MRFLKTGKQFAELFRAKTRQGTEALCVVLIFHIDAVDFRRLKITFHDMGSGSRAKPYGIIGAVIIFAVLDAPPANHSALTRSVLATRTPHILEFTEEERGGTVYIATCRQNEKGEQGPWSDIESAIVP